MVQSSCVVRQVCIEYEMVLCLTSVHGLLLSIAETTFNSVLELLTKTSNTQVKQARKIFT
jgi:hypothetical protein